MGFSVTGSSGPASSERVSRSVTPVLTARTAPPGFRRMLGDVVRFNRRARAHSRRPASTSVTSLEGSWLDTDGHADVRRLVPGALSAPRSGRPTRDLHRFPARDLRTVLRQSRDAAATGRPAWRTVPGGARRLRRRDQPGPRADRLRVAHPSQDRAARPPASSCAPTAGEPTVRHDRRRGAQRPGARAARETRPAPSARSSARSATNRTPRCCTPTPRSARRCERAWAAGTSTSPADTRSVATVTYHMNRLQTISSHVTAADPEPDTTRSGPMHVLARSSTRTRSSTADACTLSGGSRDQRRRRHLVCRCLLGLRLPRGRRDQRPRRRASWEGR